MDRVALIIHRKCTICDTGGPISTHHTASSIQCLLHVCIPSRDAVILLPHRIWIIFIFGITSTKRPTESCDFSSAAQKWSGRRLCASLTRAIRTIVSSSAEPSVPSIRDIHPPIIHPNTFGPADLALPSLSARIKTPPLRRYRMAKRDFQDDKREDVIALPGYLRVNTLSSIQILDTGKGASGCYCLPTGPICDSGEITATRHPQIRGRRMISQRRCDIARAVCRTGVHG